MASEQPNTRQPQQPTGTGKSQVSLWIDTYDDIFSDFDPRPYAQRCLSDDFLIEAKKVVRERSEGRLELRFLVPQAIRSSATEATIRKRLRDHFTKHARRLSTERKKRVIGGILTACAGFAIIAVAAGIPEGDDFLHRLIGVILEPSGWFTMWFGFDTVFYGTREIAADAAFYTRMVEADIVFESF